MNMSKGAMKSGILLGLLIFVSGTLPIYGQKTLQQAIRLTRSEQFDAATREYKALIAQNPNDGNMYYYFGDNFLERYFSDTSSVSMTEATEAASLAFEKGVQMDPKNPINFAGLGEIALLKDNRTQADSYFSKAYALLPSKQNKGVTMHASQHALVLVKIADAYVKAGVNDTAAIFSNLRAAEKLDSKLGELYIVRGDAYINFLNDGSKAINNYNMAAALNPDSPTAQLRIGQLWMKAKQYQMALNYYEKVSTIDSNYGPAYRELGFLLKKANRPADAKKNFKKFLDLSAGNLSAQLQYINTLIELQEYGEAVNQVMQVQAIDSMNNDLNRALAYSYYETGQYEKGLESMEKFLKKSAPEKIRQTDVSYYGRLLSKMKMDSLAALQLVRAYEMDTSKSDLLSEAALSYNKIKSYDKAAQIYIRKIDLKKGSSMDYYNLGKTYYNLQDFVKADSVLAIFNEQQPAYIQGYVWRARAASNIDPDSKLGTAKPVYESIVEKTASDTAKYAKERAEAFYYLAYYYFLQYNTTKDKENAVKSMEYCDDVIAIDPNDDKAVKAKQIIDVLKKNVH
jgi:tetratricopeptide (TPR) repeat protein